MRVFERVIVIGELGGEGACLNPLILRYRVNLEFFSGFSQKDTKIKKKFEKL